MIISPAGNIKFVALNRKVKRKPTDAENTVYTIKLEFDGSEPGVAEFKSQIEDVNPGLIGTKGASKPGNFTVQASTRYEVEVFDGEGNTILDVPSISEGKAIMGVTPNTKNPLGGSLYLNEVGLLEYVEYEGSSEADRKQSILDAIKKINS